MARYLVVANQTLAGSALIPLIADRAARDAATVHVVVPATDPAHESPPALGAAAERAQDRLDKALESLANAGVQATGEVGVADPIQAIRNALKAGSFTELMISTFPPGFSRWLHADLPHRGVREFEIPAEWIQARIGAPAQPAVTRIEAPPNIKP